MSADCDISINLNKREKRLDAAQKKLSYVLFACVISIVLQGLFCLLCYGRLNNTIADHSHPMYYSQIYFKICTVAAAFVLAVYYIFRIYRFCDGKRRGLDKTVLDSLILIPLALMLVWAFIATLKSPDIKKSLYGSGYINEGFFTVLGYGVVFLASFAIRNEVKFAKTAVLWTFIGLSGLITVSLFNVELYGDFLEKLFGLNFNISPKVGVFNNSNHFGYFLAMSSTATFGAIVFSKHKIAMFAAAMILPLNVYYLFVCDTLGANLAFIGGIIFIVCSGAMSKKLNAKRLLLALAISAVVTLIVELCGRSQMWRSYIQLFRDIKSVFSSGSGGGDASSAGTNRFGLWMRTIKVIEMSPWFGKGLDLYYSNNIYDPTLDVAHNEYLTIASNIGILGLVMYAVALVWWFTRAVVGRARLETADFILLSGAFAYLISAVFGNSFTYTYPYFLVFFALSIQPAVRNRPAYERLQRKNENILSVDSASADTVQTVNIE